MLKNDRMLSADNRMVSGYLFFMEVKFKVPTINQLVRKGRKTTSTKSTAPALQKGYNSKKKTTRLQKQI